MNINSGMNIQPGRIIIELTNSPTTEREYLNTHNETISETPEDSFKKSLNRQIFNVILFLIDNFVQLLIIFLVQNSFINMSIALKTLIICQTFTTILRFPCKTRKNELYSQEINFLDNFCWILVFTTWEYIDNNEKKMAIISTIFVFQLLMRFFASCSCDATNDFEIICKSFFSVISFPLFTQHLTILVKITDYISLNWVQAFWGYLIFLVMMIAVGTLVGIFVIVNLHQIFMIIFDQTPADKYLKTWLVVILVSFVLLLSYGLVVFSFLFSFSMILDDLKKKAYFQEWNFGLLCLTFFSIFTLVLLKSKVRYF